MRFKAAAVQMWSTRVKDENLAAMERLVREAASQGANLIALPEMFSYLGLDNESIANGETIPGPTSDRLAALARELGVYLHGGSFLELTEDGQKVYNTSIMINPAGEIVGKYRKLHLSDIRLRDQATVVAERDVVRGGDQVVVAETELGRFGMTICYDLRFPELYRLLTLKGAEVIFVPSAFTMFTGKDHWEVLLRARAIENQCYVIAAGQVGVRSANEAYYGRSVIIDPWGVVLSQAADREGIIYADIDLQQVRELRERLPSLACRRPDVYTLETV